MTQIRLLDCPLNLLLAPPYIQRAFERMIVFGEFINDKYIVAREQVMEGFRKKGPGFNEIPDTYFVDTKMYKNFEFSPTKCEIIP